VASALEQATGEGRSPRPAQKRPAQALAVAEGALVWFVLLILSGPPRMRQRTLDEALESPLSTLDPTAVLHIAAWAGTGALVVYILCRQPRRARVWLRTILRNNPTRWYLLFGLLGIASAAYSPSRIYTLFFAGKIIIGVLAVAMICTFTHRSRPDQALRLLFVIVVIRAVALVLLYLVDPALVGSGGVLFKDYRLYGGPVIEDYGESALLAGLWLLTVGIFGSTRVKRTIAMFGYGVSWLLLLASETRSAIATGLIFFVIMASLGRSSRGRAALFVVGALSLSLSILWNLSQAVIDTATRSGSGINTLSGRTDAFDYLMDWWSQRPILGYGYGAGTRNALVDFVERTGLAIGAGHDVLSTVLVDLGLVGATILALAFLAAWGQIPMLWRCTRRFPRQRIVVAQLTCLAVWVTNQSIVGASLEAPSAPFFVLIGTAFALKVTCSARRRQGWHSLTRERPAPGARATAAPATQSDERPSQTFRGRLVD
jgi:O-Antigen ligase